MSKKYKEIKVTHHQKEKGYDNVTSVDLFKFGWKPTFSLTGNAYKHKEYGKVRLFKDNSWSHGKKRGVGDQTLRMYLRSLHKIKKINESLESNHCDYGHKAPSYRLAWSDEPLSGGSFLCKDHWREEMDTRQEHNERLDQKATILPWPGDMQYSDEDKKFLSGNNITESSGPCPDCGEDMVPFSCPQCDIGSVNECANCPYIGPCSNEQCDTNEKESSKVTKQCPGCNGKGKYTSAFTIEDPCKQCGGTGKVNESLNESVDHNSDWEDIARHFGYDVIAPNFNFHNPPTGDTAKTDELILHKADTNGWRHYPGGKTKFGSAVDKHTRQELIDYLSSYHNVLANKQKTCPDCNGSKTYTSLFIIEPCKTCNGAGTINESWCNHCNGFGHIHELNEDVDLRNLKALEDEKNHKDIGKKKVKKTQIKFFNRPEKPEDRADSMKFKSSIFKMDPRKSEEMMSESFDPNVLNELMTKHGFRKNKHGEFRPNFISYQHPRHQKIRINTRSGQWFHHGVYPNMEGKNIEDLSNYLNKLEGIIEESYDAEQHEDYPRFEQVLKNHKFKLYSGPYYEGPDIKSYEHPVHGLVGLHLTGWFHKGKKELIHGETPDELNHYLATLNRNRFKIVEDTEIAWAPILTKYGYEKSDYENGIGTWWHHPDTPNIGIYASVSSMGGGWGHWNNYRNKDDKDMIAASGDASPIKKWVGQFGPANLDKYLAEYHGGTKSSTGTKPTGTKKCGSCFGKGNHRVSWGIIPCHNCGGTGKTNNPLIESDEPRQYRCPISKCGELFRTIEIYRMHRDKQHKGFFEPPAVATDLDKKFKYDADKKQNKVLRYKDLSIKTKRRLGLEENYSPLSYETVLKNHGYVPGKKERDNEDIYKHYSGNHTVYIIRPQGYPLGQDWVHKAEFPGRYSATMNGYTPLELNTFLTKEHKENKLPQDNAFLHGIHIKGVNENLFRGSKKKSYVGTKLHTGEHEVFWSEKEPTDTSHGGTYISATGPFKTKKGAYIFAKYGKGNPHMPTVGAVEKLAKKWDKDDVPEWNPSSFDKGLLRGLKINESVSELSKRVLGVLGKHGYTKSVPQRYPDSPQYHSYTSPDKKYEMLIEPARDTNYWEHLEIKSAGGYGVVGRHLNRTESYPIDNYSNDWEETVHDIPADKTMDAYLTILHGAPVQSGAKKCGSCFGAGSHRVSWGTIPCTNCGGTGKTNNPLIESATKPKKKLRTGFNLKHFYTGRPIKVNIGPHQGKKGMVKSVARELHHRPFRLEYFVELEDGAMHKFPRHMIHVVNESVPPTSIQYHYEGDEDFLADNFNLDLPTGTAKCKHCGANTNLNKEEENGPGIPPSSTWEGSGYNYYEPWKHLNREHEDEWDKYTKEYKQHLDLTYMYHVYFPSLGYHNNTPTTTVAAPGTKKCGSCFGAGSHRVSWGTIPCTNCGGTGKTNNPLIESVVDGHPFHKLALKHGFIYHGENSSSPDWHRYFRGGGQDREELDIQPNQDWWSYYNSKNQGSGFQDHNDSHTVEERVNDLDNIINKYSGPAKEKPCTDCGGTGKYTSLQFVQDCPTCGGKGKINESVEKIDWRPILKQYGYEQYSKHTDADVWAHKGDIKTHQFTNIGTAGGMYGTGDWFYHGPPNGQGRKVNGSNLRALITLLDELHPEVSGAKKCGSCFGSGKIKLANSGLKLKCTNCRGTGKTKNPIIESVVNENLSKPFISLGKFHPSEYNKETIQKELSDFITSKGLTIDNPFNRTFTGGEHSHPIDVRSPDWHKNHPGDQFWHQDGSFKPQSRRLVIWATEYPTLIKNTKEQIHQLEPHEVAIVFNHRSEHSNPFFGPSSQNRWFARTYLGKTKKKIINIKKDK